MASVNFADVITFTRASGGGRFNAQGQYEWLPANEPRIDFDPVTGECRGLLIEESRTNLVGNSGQISLWTKGGGPVGTVPRAAVAPDGTLTACSFTFGADYQYLLGSLSTATAGTAYCASVFVKKGTGRFVLRISTTDSVQTVKARIDSVAGTITALGGSGGSTNLGTFKLPAGPDYDRYAVVGSFATTSSLTSIMLVREAATDVGGTVWGAQLEQGTFPTSYIPTPAVFTGRASTGTYFDADGVLKIAAAGEARYTHAYVDGKWVSAGLLLEESRTNLLTYSSDFANAVWTKQFVSIEDNAATSPDGAVNAAKMVTAAGTTRGVYLIPSGYALNTDHTLSVFAKAAGRNTLRLEWNGSGTVEFDLISGTKLGGPATAGIAHVGNGWYRCWTVGQRSSTGQAVVIRFGAAEQTGGDGTSGIYIWGAQLEAGSSPTSYIPTTTAQVTRAADTSTSSQVTRAADIASVNDLSPWFNASEGTFVVYQRRRWLPTDGISIEITDGTAANRTRLIFQGNAGLSLYVTALGAPQRFVELGTYAQSGTRAAFSYNTTNHRVSMDGGYPLELTANIPTVNRMWLGRTFAGAGIFNGHIESIRYFPRALTSEELQEITA